MTLLRGQALRCALSLLVASVLVPRHAPPVSQQPLTAPRPPVSRTGHPLVTVRVGSHPMALAIEPRSRRVFVASWGPLHHPRYSSGYDHVPAGRGTVSVLDADTGQVVRTVVVGAVIAHLPLSPAFLLVDEVTKRAFVFSGQVDAKFSGRITDYAREPGVEDVLDATTGRVLHTLRLPVRPRTGVVDEQASRLFLRNADGSITIIDTRTGLVLKRVIPGNADPLAPPAIALDAGRHRLFVGEGSDLDVFDETTARVLLTISQQDPNTAQMGPEALYQALAIDAQTGQVLTHLNTGRGTGSVMNAFDPMTGDAVQRLVLNALAPSALALDTARHRALLIGVGLDYNSQWGYCTVNVIDTQAWREIPTNFYHLPTLGDLAVCGTRLAHVVLDRRHGYAFVVPEDYEVQPDYVLVVDLRSGQVIRVMPVATGCGGLVVDEQRGRVYIANRGAGTVSVYDAAHL